MGERTIVSKAHSRTKSVRVTIPAAIVDAYKISEGDVLDWSVEEIRGKKAVVVRKMVVG